MFVAQELRKKSIAEYLLYMWQIEDIIRAYGCSLPVIKKNYVDRFDFTPEQREEELDWFGNLIRMMNEEGKREGGHLNINKVILKDVIDLHGMLLQSTKFPSALQSSAAWPRYPKISLFFFGNYALHLSYPSVYPC